MERYLELDNIKGIAVILMITFHIFYLMNNMGLNQIDSSNTFLSSIGKISHVTFLILSGINLFISYKKNKKDKKKFYKKQIKRSKKLLFNGMIITLFTYLIFGEYKFVKFGILHFMSFAGIFSMLVVDKKMITLLLIPLLIILKNYLNSNNSISNNFCNNNSLLCLITGIEGPYLNNYGSTLDNFSILYALPLYLCGMVIGNLFYNKESDKKINEKDNIISSIGKNSLKIYMIHWIVLYIIIYMMGGRP